MLCAIKKVLFLCRFPLCNVIHLHQLTLLSRPSFVFQIAVMSGAWARGTASIVTAAGNATTSATAAAQRPAVQQSAPVSNVTKSPFDAYVVLDFEATCEKDRRLAKQEIIEFPMLVVDPATLKVVAEFQRYIKPIHNPTLSKFCVELTGITQDVVDKAQEFAVVFKEALAWLATADLGDRVGVDRSYCLVTCGDWDLKTMLPHQVGHTDPAKLPPQPIPLSFTRWLNIKQVFSTYFPTKERVTGMESMLSALKMDLDGRHHSGIDDCRNIAKILIEVLKKDAVLLPSSTRQFNAWRHPKPETSSAALVAMKSSIVAPEDAPVPSTFDASIVKPGSSGTQAAVPNGTALSALLAVPPPVRAPNSQEKTTFSKKLSLVLRHRAAELGIPIAQNGLVAWQSLKSLPYFKHLDDYTLGCLVRDCPKQRFRVELADDGSTILIGANQGHSMEGIEADLVPITDVKDCPVAVHGTYYKGWDGIKVSGLSRMARQHIHFAQGLPGDSNVISGMRSSAQVLVYLDVAKCLANGVPLFRSRNGVILSPGVGNTGSIPVEYFERVVDVATGNRLK